jgi:tetratricopeptide (TPR) repeat protein/photosystem II stability/assembly factor-like uncharacterized protein
MADKPDFIVDPSGNAQDVRGQKNSPEPHPSSAQKPGSRPARPRGDSYLYTQYNQTPKSRPGFIVIPIGLLITLIVGVLRLFGGHAAQNTHSDTNVSMMNAGVYSYNAGDFDEAILNLNIVIMDDPNFGEAYNNRGLAYFAKGETDRAMVDFDKAIQLLPDLAVPYSNRGLVYLAMGQPGQALADLDKAIELNPKFSKAYYNRGLGHLDLGNTDQAIADFDKAIDFTPEWIASMQMKMPTGESPLTRSLTNDLMNSQTYADLPKVYASRAMANFQKGNDDSAMADLKKAVELGLDAETAQQIDALFSAGNGSNPPAANGSISSGLEGAQIHALAVNPWTPATVYAAGSGGVFKSTDGGVNWNITNLNGSDASALAIDPASPSTIYAGIDGGVFKSSNGGENWSVTGLKSGVSCLAVDPLTPATLYAGGDQGVFKSVDGGGSWEAVNNGMDDEPTGIHTVSVIMLAIDPLNPGTLYAGTRPYTFPGTWRYYPGSVFKSTDGGEGWSQLTWSYSTFTALAVDRLTPGTLYAGSDESIEESTDGGLTWSRIKVDRKCSTVHVLAIDPLRPTTLYLGTGCGLYISMDGGENWSLFDSRLPASDILAIVIDPLTPTKIYVGTNGGGVFVIR